MPVSGNKLHGPGVFLDKIARNPGFLILLLFFVAGLLLYRDFGISWDEDQQRKTGIMSFNYVFHDDGQLFNWVDKDYGVAVELPLVLMEQLPGMQTAESIFLARHLVTHLFFLAGAWAIYLLVKLWLKDNIVAAVAMLLYLLHPRIYADSFYNTKDIPFLSLYVITLYQAARAFRTQRYSHFLLLGICTGLLVNIRIMGVMLFAFICLFLLLDMFRPGSRALPQIKRLLLYISSSVLVLYGSWPYLWTKPGVRFTEAFLNMSRFRWTGSNLFRGMELKATELPWYYSLHWLGITTPLFFLFAGISGTALALWCLVRYPVKSLSNTPERNSLLFLLSFFVPLAAVIVFHSVLYDGWRQLFFIYPSFVLLAVSGIHRLAGCWGSRRVFPVVFGFIVLQAIGILRLHPFENVYFNSFVPRQPEYIRHHYDQDYWGLAYKQSLAYILAQDSSREIRIAYDVTPCRFNKEILFTHSRLRLTDNKDSADYYLVSYRYHPQDYKKFAGKEWHSIIVNNSRINTVFRLKN